MLDSRFLVVSVGVLPAIHYFGRGRWLRHRIGLAVFIGLVTTVALGSIFHVGSHVLRWGAAVASQWAVMLLAAAAFRVVFGRMPIDQYGLGPDNPGTIADRLYQYLALVGLAVVGGLVAKWYPLN